MLTFDKVCFVDLMRNCGAFSAEEAEDYMK